MPSSRSSSDDDEDVVVLKVCGNRNCHRTDNVQMDEETGELYCEHCRSLFARADSEGFRVLLTEQDVPLVRLIFAALDEDKRGYWDHVTWVRFQSFTDHPSDTEIDSGEALKQFFAEEYDIKLRPNKESKYVITLEDLENMYGGFFFNNVDALTEDAAALEDGGVINTETLE